MESCDTISNLIDQEEKRQYARQESFDENGEGDMDSQKSFEQRKQKFMEFLFNNRNNAKEETKICNDEFNSNKIPNRTSKPISNLARNGAVVQLATPISTNFISNIDP